MTTVPEFKICRLRDAVVAQNECATPEQAVELIKTQAQGSPCWREDVENFGILLLSTRKRLRGFFIVSNGGLDTVLVHARDVFKPAILASAAAIILFHNHPSGDPLPSEADIRVTRDLIRAGQLLKIEVADHIIVGFPLPGQSRDWVSLRELGYFL